MKKLLFGLILVISSTLWSQTPPVLVGWQVDTMCNSDYSFQIVHTIEVFDAEADHTTINIIGYDYSDFYYMSVDNPVYNAGENSRFFTIYADAGFGLSPGLNLSDVDIIISGNLANDLVSTTAVITGLPIYGNIPITFDVSGLHKLFNVISSFILF
ncbi:MAG: hypothetical protein IPH24_08625 [Crocinitomicaceae bacterium]|nr:hypothetical protein [Crocinitomicaceae bacterium]